MTLDLCHSFVSAKYLENKLTELDQTLYNRLWDVFRFSFSKSLELGLLLHEKHCSWAIVRISDNSSFCLVRCFTSQSTAMVTSGRSVHLTTLFTWANLTKQLTRTSCTYFRLKLFHDQFPQKYGTGPGINSQPLDL